MNPIVVSPMCYAVLRSYAEGVVAGFPQKVSMEQALNLCHPTSSEVICEISQIKEQQQKVEIALSDMAVQVFYNCQFDYFPSVLAH